MPILYDPLAVFRSTFLTGRLFSEVLCSTMFWLSLVLFVLEREIVRRLHNERVSRLNEEMTWPTTLFATLFSYMLGLFTNNCYVRPPVFEAGERIYQCVAFQCDLFTSCLAKTPRRNGTRTTGALRWSAGLA
jgi:hypothetical protein